MWKDIPGYKTPYRINEAGEVQQFARGKWRPLSVKITPRRAEVHLRKTDGKQQRVGVLRLMDKYFMDGYAAKNGLCACPKNGAKADCALENLCYKTQAEIGKKSMRRTASKPVVRYDRKGNPTVYKSVTEAARKNGLTPSSLDRRLYHGVLDPRGYRWELLK